jgi:2'-5' RNA ligase
MDRAHLTLRFLGELPTPNRELVASLQAPLAACPHLSLALGEPGTFGGRSPQVVWVGLAGPSAERLRELGEALARGAGLGPPERRPFRPHLTLARVRRRRRIESGLLSQALEVVSVQSLAFEAREAVLFSSNAGSGAPLRHEVLARLRLGTGAPEVAAPAPAAPPANPGRNQLAEHLATYLASAAAKPPPSRAAHLALASAARVALEHALAWPPAPELVTAQLAGRGPAAQARARRRLAERAPIEERRTRQGLEDARRRVEDLLEEAEEDPPGALASTRREAAEWIARHGLPEAWFSQEAARVGLELGTVPSSGQPLAAGRASQAPEGPSESSVDEPYRTAVEAAWGEDAAFVAQRAPAGESDADRLLDLSLPRAPRPSELTKFAAALASALGHAASVLGVRSLGGGRRRLRVAWKEATPLPAQESRPPRGSSSTLEAERAELLASLAGQEPERHARRDFLLGASPTGDPVLLRGLLDQRGRADLACWAGPWEGRTRVALALGERALARGLSAGVLLRRILTGFGGAGGGSPRLAEGACPAEPAEVLAVLRAWVLEGGLS